MDTFILPQYPGSGIVADDLNGGVDIAGTVGLTVQPSHMLQFDSWPIVDGGAGPQREEQKS